MKNGAWKSSDGGTITPLGASGAQVSAAGTILAGGSNVRGVTIRSLSGYSTGGGAASILAGGKTIFAVYNGAGDMAREIFVPAGQAITATLTAGTMLVGITYDIH
tara:strand:- start:2424 stop:2738 length:315 start_codon:yes stop_codon:yes gene_type:complete